MSEAPHKPRRTRRRILWAVLLLFVAFFAWQAYDILTGKPDPRVDYATPYYELMESVQKPAGVNGWELFSKTVNHIGGFCVSEFDAARVAREQRIAAEREAAGEFGPPPEEYYLPYFGDVTRGPFDSAAWELHLGVIAALEADGLLDDLSQLCTMDRYMPPFDSSRAVEEIALSGAAMSNFREVGRLNAARLRLAAAGQQWDTFTRLVDESMCLARIMSIKPHLLNKLIVDSFVAMIIDELRHSVIEFTPPERVCRELQTIIDARLPLPSAAHHLAGQDLAQLDHLQRLYTSSGRLPISEWGKHRGDLNGMFPANAVEPMHGAIADVLAIGVPGHRTAARWTSEVFDEAIAFSNRPLGDRIRERFAPTRSVDEAPIHQVVLKGYGFAFLERFLVHTAVLECEVRAVLLMLAVEAYRSKHGQPPATLADLVPDYLDALPVDPASDSGYGYRLLTDDPDGRTYLLYSFGIDGADDGGEEEWIADWYDPEKPGTDHVINRPRSTASK